MNRLNRSLVLCAAAAACAAFSGCSNRPEAPLSWAPTAVVAVAPLDLPEGYAAPGSAVPVAPWDLPADYVVPAQAAFDAAALDVPAPITVVEG